MLGGKILYNKLLCRKERSTFQFITMLSPETNNEIAALIRSVFYDQAQLIYLLYEEMYAPGELDPAEVSSTVDAEFLSWKT